MNTTIPARIRPRRFILGAMAASLLTCVPYGTGAGSVNQPHTAMQHAPAVPATREYSGTFQRYGDDSGPVITSSTASMPERTNRDKALVRRVERALQSHHGIRVDASKGTVMLDGTVTDFRERESILLETRAVQGVKEVVTERIHVRTR